MSEQASRSGGTNGPAGSPRLRDVLGLGSGPARFATVAELVPWRGALEDATGAKPHAFARELAQHPRIDALSITDSAGGHPMLSPEVLAKELMDAGKPSIVHVACRDRNRNELLSLAWRLATAGIEDLLVLTGDYPAEGYLGVARPVFDVDSVALLQMYARLNAGIAGTVVTRPHLRDGATHVPDLEPSRPPVASEQTDFLLGAAVSPFKTVERDQVPQYLKLEMKVRAGARYAITQVGWDVRKLEELQRWVTDRQVPVALFGNVFLLTRGSTRVLASGEIPGVVVPPSLIEVVEREAAAEDKGKAFFLDLAARQVAIIRALGYAGGYIGGASKAEDVARIIELADGYANTDWRDLVESTSFAVPNTWYAYGPDDAPGSAPRFGKAPGVPLSYRFDRAMHGLVFADHAPLHAPAAAVHRFAERAHLGKALHVVEQVVKTPLFDCRDCGDCSLPEIAYLCPESQCVKNQRNGPCGGSTAGDCEVPGRDCIWARAYDRLAPYGEALPMLEREPTVCDNSLQRTSAWANAFLKRDHASRPPIG